MSMYVTCKVLRTPRGSQDFFDKEIKEIRELKELDKRVWMGKRIPCRTGEWKMQMWQNAHNESHPLL
jgi:hypothetical protein